MARPSSGNQVCVHTRAATISRRNRLGRRQSLSVKGVIIFDIFVKSTIV